MIGSNTKDHIVIQTDKQRYRVKLCFENTTLGKYEAKRSARSIMEVIGSVIALYMTQRIKTDRRMEEEKRYFGLKNEIAK